MFYNSFTRFHSLSINSIFNSTLFNGYRISNFISYPYIAQRKYPFQLLKNNLCSTKDIKSSLTDSNDNLKVCYNCKHFNMGNETCHKFGTTNIVTGIKIYENASNLRLDTNKCGYDGRYYEKNDMKYISILYYKITTDPFDLLCLMLSVGYLTAIVGGIIYMLFY